MHMVYNTVKITSTYIVVSREDNTKFQGAKSVNKTFSFTNRDYKVFK